MNKYDVWLKEVPLDDGLSIEDIHQAPLETKAKPLLPINIEGNNSFAIGFITLSAMDQLVNMDKDCEMENFIKNILNDMDLETENGEYCFKAGENGFLIRLKR